MICPIMLALLHERQVPPELLVLVVVEAAAVEVVEVVDAPPPAPPAPPAPLGGMVSVPLEQAIATIATKPARTLRCICCDGFFMGAPSDATGRLNAKHVGTTRPVCGAFPRLPLRPDDEVGSSAMKPSHAWILGSLALSLVATLGASCSSKSSETNPSASPTTSSGSGGAAGTGGMSGAGGAEATDGGPMQDGDLFPDGTAFDSGPPSSKFFVLVTETAAGSNGVDAWGGILRYDIASDGAQAMEAIAIDKALVHDPIGLAFRTKSAEVFVGNRHGNIAADGVVGSITRFLYKAKDQSFTPNGEITGNNMGAVHQIALSPAEDALFAATYTGGDAITRFQIDSMGQVLPGGTLLKAGSMLGISVAPDGKRLYATQDVSQGGNVIRQFELPSGSELPALTVPNAQRMHLMVLAGTELYVSDIAANVVYRFFIGANDDLNLVENVPADAPISVALSPDGLELFTTAHQYGATAIIDRFSQGDAGTWVPTTTITTPFSLGGTLVFSAAAVPTQPL